MKNNEIRSKYIQDLIKEKDDFKKKLNEMASESLKDVLSEEVNKELRKLIAEADEDDDSYTEEEINEPEQTEEPTDSEKMDTDDETADNGEPEVGDADLEVTDNVADNEEGSEESDDDVWNELEQYKDEDGEFDLRGMDKDSVVKVLKLISQDDVNGVRVYQNPTDDTIVLSDDETEKQYVIDIDGTSDDATVDVTEEGCQEQCNNVNEELGYTTDYQKKTAMTTPSNNEPADSSETYSMDDGVPTGTEKPYGKKADNMDPFDNKVNENDEETEFELEVDEEPVEEATNVGGFAAQNSTAKSHVPNSNGRSARNQSKGGEYTSTQKPRYSATNEQLEKIMKKANEIFTENKQLKGIVAELRNQINEAIVINYNMGRVIKLMTENSTSKEEKLNIIKRFDNVRTLKESKEAFTQIDSELKNPNRIAKINNMIDKQLSESTTKNNASLVETQIYQSDDLNETLSFMARMDAIK